MSIEQNPYKVRLGQGPIIKGYQYVGYREGDALIVQLVEAFGSQWIIDTFEVKNITEMLEYIEIDL